MQISILHNASWSCKCFLHDLGHYQFDWAWFGQGQTTWTLPLYLMFLHHTSVRGCLSNHSFWNTHFKKMTKKYVSLQNILKASAKSNTWAGVGLFFVGGKALYLFICLALIYWGGTESWSHLPLHLISFAVATVWNMSVSSIGLA